MIPRRTIMCYGTTAVSMQHAVGITKVCGPLRTDKAHPNCGARWLYHADIFVPVQFVGHWIDSGFLRCWLQ